MTKKLIPVILCGGSGQRLWPVSRETSPKQFVPLLDNESLFKKTLTRTLNIIEEAKKVGNMSVEDVIITSHKKYQHYIQNSLNEFDGFEKNINIIYEPCKKNTAPAILSAAFFALQNLSASKDDVLLILSADHLINNKDGFLKDVFTGIEIATANKIVTFGISPTHPATGYGYIETGQSFKSYQNAFSISSFTEKPNTDTALSYIAKGNFLWNSGIFIISTGKAIEAGNIHLANVSKYSLESIKDAKITTKNNLTECFLSESSFSKNDDISIDYGILEKETDSITVIKASFDWSDVGSFESIYDVSSKDSNLNYITGEAITIDTKNSLILSKDNITTVAIGLENLIIVSSKDSVLVCNKGKSGSIKNICETLEKNNNPKLKSSLVTQRPWGYYEELSGGDNDGYKVKKIVVFPGQMLSSQLHHKRQEQWVITKGEATVILDDSNEMTLSKGQTVFISKEQKHRLINKTKENIELIEVQTGTYLGEDDIVRFDDIYGRC